MADEKKPCAVKYRRREFPPGQRPTDWRQLDRAGAQLIDIEPCCEGMEAYLRVGAVAFGDRPEYRYRRAAKFYRQGNSEYGLSIFKASSDGCGEEIGYSAYGISFCPACGAPVVCECVETIRLVPKTVKKEVEETVYEEAPAEPTGGATQ